MSWLSGKKDAEQGKGQKDPNDFKSDTERKEYQTGHAQEKAKKDNENKK